MSRKALMTVSEMVEALDGGIDVSRGAHKGVGHFDEVRQT